MARRVVAHGRVQGVFFRASTRDLATRQGVTGWVRNDPGGTVTAHLEGAESDVAALVDWMRAGGPPDARVTDVEVRSLDDEGHDGFRVRH